MSDTKKICTKCNKEKLTVDFSSRMTQLGKVVLKARCKACTTIDNREYASRLDVSQYKHSRALLRFLIEAYKFRDGKRLKKYINEAEIFLKIEEQEVGDDE